MVSDFGKGMGMTGIDPLAPDQDFFGVVFEHIVGVVGPVGQGHAAARMVGVSIGNSKERGESQASKVKLAVDVAV